jgi:hypothetical protein
MSKERMTVSEALCVAEQVYISTKNLKGANLTKEAIALVVLAQRVRELSRTS